MPEPQGALQDGYRIDTMTEVEARLLGEWAAAEGWNPGLRDIDVAWSYDPGAFIALRHGSELAGGGAILSYDGAAGFMGLFIVRADHRGRGLGKLLWHERLRRLRARLAPGAPIGMDGVFAMVPFYEAGGFRLLHRDLRFQGAGAGAPDPAVVPLRDIARDELCAYDRAIFGVPREGFLRRWLDQPGGTGCALRDARGLRGYGFLRPCRAGYKIAPLFCDDATGARRLLMSLAHASGGQQIQIDIPEPNVAALALMQELRWEQSFGCARMVNGASAPMPVERIFGVTSFEFG